MELGSSLWMTGPPSCWNLPRSSVVYASGRSAQRTIYPLNGREDGNIYLLTSVPHWSEGVLWGINLLARPGCTRMSIRQVLLDEPCQEGQRRSLVERGKSIEQLRQEAVRLHLWEAGLHGDGGDGKVQGVQHTPSSGHRPLEVFWGPGVPGTMQKVFYQWGGLLA